VHVPTWTGARGAAGALEAPRAAPSPAAPRVWSRAAAPRGGARRVALAAPCRTVVIATAGEPRDPPKSARALLRAMRSLPRALAPLRDVREGDLAPAERV